MNESKALIATLKSAIKLRGVTYKDIAENLGISESSVKRTFSEESFSLARLESICKFLSMSLYDLIQASKESLHNSKKELSLKQEQALADDQSLFTGFHLALNGWTLHEMITSYGWTEPECIKVFTELDKLKLIELLPKNKYHLLVPNIISWRQGGPIFKKYRSIIQSEFLDHDFSHPLKYLNFKSIELSQESATIIQRKIRQLDQDIAELVLFDSSLPQKHKTSWGMLFAIRPWVFSVIEQKKRIKRS